MNIQTKSTLIICGLFIIEILPVPFTSLYSLYAVRKRPNWLPGVVEALYEGKASKNGETIADIVPHGHDPMLTRKKCTMALLAIFIVDLLVPVVIPTALYVVRARPQWFKRLTLRLYADKLPRVAEPEKVFAWHHDESPVSEEMQQKLAELELQNLHFAKYLTVKVS